MITKLKTHEQQYHVQGKVARNRKPTNGLAVKIFHKALRQEKLLGETNTNSDGLYKIAYSPNGEKDRPNLIARVYNTAGKEIGASKIRYNAPAKATINITLDPNAQISPFEYELLINQLSPVLKKVPLTALTPEEQTFVAKKSGLRKKQLSLLIDCAQCVKESGLRKKQVSLLVDSL